MASLSDLIGWMGGGAAALQLIDYALKRGERRAASRKNMIDEVGKLWERVDALEVESETERKARRDAENQMDKMARDIDKLQAVTLERDQAIKERDEAIKQRDEARRLHLEDSEANNARIIALEAHVQQLQAQVERLQAQLDEASEELRKNETAFRAGLTGGSDPSD